MRDASGFTLVEMLIVVAIIGLVAAFVGPRLMAQLDRSKASAARVQIRSLAASLETMRLDLGRYPSDQEGLKLLVEAPSGTVQEEIWEGPYLDSGLPRDPWGRPYVYQAPASPDGRPRIGSLGADGSAGGVGIAADIYFGDGRDMPAT
ncbi:type II secretion system major pseudopilin GspG [Sphingomonas oleivorans]|uniref:type II secretion system major pseudopilin GspG n=1 Tax=Sphingomonas oleivorans TaxID=1735121 RepID=UPI001A9D0540|nr:type II secretion system major pseudopilin GspG [Sphingomonas oleivorans]